MSLIAAELGLRERDEADNWTLVRRKVHDMRAFAILTVSAFALAACGDPGSTGSSELQQTRAKESRTAKRCR